MYHTGKGKEAEKRTARDLFSRGLPAIRAAGCWLSGLDRTDFPCEEECPAFVVARPRQELSLMMWAGIFAMTTCWVASSQP